MNLCHVTCELQELKDRLEVVTKEYKRRLGPVLGFRGKSAPNQITGLLEWNQHKLLKT